MTKSKNSRKDQIIDNNTVATRMRTMGELLNFAIFNLRSNLARRNKKWSSSQLDLAISKWMLERPGAEFGDGVGAVVSVQGKHLKK